jgi:secondary thiamine-phosphate synthase enzyme
LGYTSRMIEFPVRTPQREVLVDITALVSAALVDAGCGVDGVVHVFVPHTTAGVTINEGADPSVALDAIDAMAALVPRHGPYRHAEGNSDAHVKATLVGSQVTVPLVAGRLRLGTWQSIYLAEFDGPRSRKVQIEVTCSALPGGAG